MNFISRAHMALGIALLGLVGCASTPTTSDAASSKSPAVTMESSPSGALVANDDRPVESNGATLWVHGMSCPKCVSNVDITLKKVSGVQDVSINMAQGIVRVGFAAGAHPTPRQLAHAVDDAGLTLVRMVGVQQ